MAARFPEKPNDEEKEAFKSFIYLFSRLYPCGECATEFQALLKLHPPQVRPPFHQPEPPSLTFLQTSSRGAASLHLCHLHNLVNKRLGKEEFDCSAGLAGIYDCGCADEDTGLAKEEEAPKPKGRGRQRLTPVGSKIVEEEVKRDPFTGQELVGG